jgi:putative ABC transport system ATP-binding protein
MEPVIKTENLSVIYNLGKSSESIAFQDVDIEVYPGEYIIFFGPSGCGKSSLLYTVAGIEFPTKGRAVVEGKNIAEMSQIEVSLLRRLKIGMVFQAFNLIPTLNVIDNVTLPQIFGNISQKKRMEKAKILLERFGIGHLADRLPGALSGGQQQRVALCRALIYSPPIILADEPVGNLDSESANKVMETLTELNEKENKTIILVTHDPSYLHYAHRVFHMRDGRILRVTVNPYMRSIAPVKEQVLSTELENLARVYPTLSEARLRAKALANYLLNPLDDNLVDTMEKAIEKRILGEIGEIEFKELLDKPFEEGGVGLYKQRAWAFSQKIEKVLAENDYLKKPFSSDKDETEIRAQSLRMYILDNYKGNLTFKKEEEILRLDSFIKLRLRGEISREKLKELLDISFQKGGLGLNKKTAGTISRELEVVLIKYR